MRRSPSESEQIFTPNSHDVSRIRTKFERFSAEVSWTSVHLGGVGGTYLQEGGVRAVAPGNILAPPVRTNSSSPTVGWSQPGHFVPRSWISRPNIFSHFPGEPPHLYSGVLFQSSPCTLQENLVENIGVTGKLCFPTVAKNYLAVELASDPNS